MKKQLLSAVYAVLCGITAMAAPGDLFYEDFEGQTITVSQDYIDLDIDGWDVVKSNPDSSRPFYWCISRDTKGEGAALQVINVKAWIDPSKATYSSPDISLKKGYDWLVTPEMTLQGGYELAFQWKSSSQALDKKQYDLRVFVLEEGQTVGELDENGHIFSFTDPDMLLESGVQPTDYGFYTVPWVGWTNYVSKIDLTPWAGKKIRVAFGYYITGVVGSYSGRIDAVNSIELDNIRVYANQAAQTPVPTLSSDRWDFGQVYVGASMRSDAITLTNTGAAGLKITDVVAPEGFEVVFDRKLEDINLKKNESMQFQVLYKASMTSSASGNIVIKTNGSDATMAVSVSKQMLAADEAFEGFEGEVFPPAGWTNLQWGATEAYIEGSKAATPRAYYQEKNYLRSPRIDATRGPVSISFNYADFYSSDDDTGADTEVRLEFSSDGGATWSVVDTYDYQDVYNTILRKSYTREAASDNCYWQFVWELTYYDSETGANAGLFYLDAVVLNGIYGAGGAPAATTAVRPAADSGEIFPRGVTLEWAPAQFATGYKLYVGSDAAASNIVNGTDLGNVLSYTLPDLAYSTTYNWKVVPYNAKGDAVSCPTWMFRTIPDPTITDLPYFEGFDNGVPPLGWNMIASGRTCWDSNTLAPYGGTASAMANARSDGNTAILETPDVVVNEPSFVTFYWGDDVAIDLVKDTLGQAVNTTKGSDGISDVSFEILVDGTWTRLALLSDKNNKYWIRERFDLSPYIGKTVAFRWVYTYYDYMRTTGACIDQFSIESAMPVKLSFNATDWDAGKVNATESFDTETAFTIYNDGSQDAEIKAVTFTHPNFRSSLKAGQKIAAGKAVNFSLGFSGNDANSTLTGVMTVETADGASASLPVRAEVLPSDTRFFGFERDVWGTKKPAGLTTVDVDRFNTISLMVVDYPCRGEAFAFAVMNYKKSDWSICYPHTGDQCLVTFGADGDGRSVEDWIISPSMVATADTEFEFWCRDYLKSDDDRFGQGRACVMVSTEGPDDLSKFEMVSSNMVPRPEKEEYTAFRTHLGKYAGKKIWVGLRHTVTDGLAYFYDDLCFTHVSDFAAGNLTFTVDDKAAISVYPNPVADVLNIAGVEAADLTVYSASGSVVAKAEQASSIEVDTLAPGAYIIVIATDSDVQTRRFIKR